MKKHLLFTLYTLLSAIVLAQSPQKINYQSVVRDSSGNIIINHSVSFFLTIREGLPGGTDLYHETHDATTNQYGLVILQIGNGVNPSTSFSSINWSSGDKYLEILFDANGPTGGYTWTYFGTTQLLSVPYALYAEKTNGLGLTGTSGQTIRHDGTSWIANSNLLNNGKNVGIGTSTPSALLHVGDSGLVIRSKGEIQTIGVGNGTVAGNARGIGAIDLQTRRDSATMIASGQYAVLGGGYSNKASSLYATISGGMNNTANNSYATISGGYYNQASGTIACIGGGDNNTASGAAATVSGGRYNVASGFRGTVGGGYSNHASNSYSTVAGGYFNQASGYESAIGGGDNNTADTSWATISGGYANNASGIYATVTGGTQNTAAGDFSWAGGSNMRLTDAADSSFALGISKNPLNITQSNSCIIYSRKVGIRTTTPGALLQVGDSGLMIKSKGEIQTTGFGNGIVAGNVRGKGAIDLQTIRDSAIHVASGQYSVIGGGAYNRSSNTYSTLSGGYYNSASGLGATVGGGYYNKATNSYATASGGYHSNASGDMSVVGGGDENTASGSAAFVGGGRKNNSMGSRGFIGGGYYNTITTTASYAVIGGGYGNIAHGYESVIGGGDTDSTGGAYSTIPGGYLNVAAGSYSFAAGYRAKARHMGSTVFGDSYNANIASSANNQFTIRATGGMRVFTNGGLTAGVLLAAGGSSWSAVSDSTLKHNIRPVDGSDILAKLMQVPISRWSYKAQDPGIEHVGPMAQDFFAAFGLGEDNKHINSLDPDGIALAGVQQLARDNIKQQEIIESLITEIISLKSELEKLKTINASKETGDANPKNEVTSK
ncbi:MAG TPA: tail fiber domain-containing protein [Bacteroidales bacterium]|nr:tail fiber domain-containing protein [Bacteroidales bacterium]